MPISTTGAVGHNPGSIQSPTQAPEGQRPAASPTHATTPVNRDRDSERARRDRIINAYGKRQLREERSLPELPVAKIMSAPVISVGPMDPLVRARQFFAEYGFRYLPVLNDNRELVGILRDQDVYRHAELGVVEDVMLYDTTHTTIATSLTEAAEALADAARSFMPVINSQLHVVGVLTSSDVLKCLVKHNLVDTFA